jgi:hypothetical protein
MTAVLVTEETADKLIKARERTRRSPIIKSDPAPSPEAKGPTGPASDPVDSLVPAGRALRDIEQDIGALLKDRRRSFFKIGALLIEAKDTFGHHGDWLPWLGKHFEQSESTAQSYMAAARYHAKYPEVGDLKLRADAINWLGGSGSGNRYGVELADVMDKVRAYIFERAKTQWVTKNDCDIAFTKFAKKVTLRPKGQLGVMTEAEKQALVPIKPPSSHPAAIAAAAAAARPGRVVRTEPMTEAEIRALADRALGICGDDETQQTKRYARQEFKALLSPAETKRFEGVLELHGILAGSVKGLCNIAPNIADLVHSRVETDKLLEASAVLQAIVAARKGDDARPAGEYLQIVRPFCNSLSAVADPGATS